MSCLPQPIRSLLRRSAPLLVLPLVASLLALTAPSASARPVEDYASYDGQRWCAQETRPGTRRLQGWAFYHFGGRRGPTLRRCDVGGRSEHKEGRAFDWTLDAARRGDRRRAWRFISNVLATDRRGNEHAKARRMGIMYIIWNDRVWKSYEGFRRQRYLASSCSTRRECSKTARHRDHVHVSLSRPGGRARTSWYARFG